MTVGLFLALGDSFTNMKRTGQDVQFKEFYLQAYSKKFTKVLIFSYSDEKVSGLPSNVEIITNKFKLHRYLYALFLPLLRRNEIKKCDVIRAYHLSGTLPAVIAKFIFNIPFVFNYAFNYKRFAKIEKKYLQFFLSYFLEPLAKAYADKIFVANKSFRMKKSVFLPNGVNTSVYKPKKRNIHNFVKILSVGRLENQKNFQSLIIAVRNLKVLLLIVGNGSLKVSLLNLARKNHVNLKILDNVPNNKMPGVYNQSDIFVSPSKIEGSPKALLEAMSCALPVIGTNTEGTNNIIADGQNGLLSKEDNPSIRRSILSLIKEPKVRLKLAKNARAFVKTNYELKPLLELEVKTVSSVAR